MISGWPNTSCVETLCHHWSKKDTMCYTFLASKAVLTWPFVSYRGVQYPKLYAEGTNAVSIKFNCTQRAHQNTMENLPVFLIMQILLAQAYPMLASALGVAWAVGKVMSSTKQICNNMFAQ